MSLGHLVHNHRGLVLPLPEPPPADCPKPRHGAYLPQAISPLARASTSKLRSLSVDAIPTATRWLPHRLGQPAHAGTFQDSGAKFSKSPWQLRLPAARPVPGLCASRAVHTGDLLWVTG